MRALLCSVLMNMLLRRRSEFSLIVVQKTLTSYIEKFKEIFELDLLGLKIISYAALRLSKQDWEVNHRGRDNYVARLTSYLNNYPEDFRAVRLGIELLQSGALLSHFKKQKNPFSDCWNSRALKERYQSLLKIAICNRNFADHPESFRAVKEMLMISAAAEKYKEPYLWTVAVSLEDASGSNYTKATTQCRWSKNIQMAELLKNGPEANRQRTWDQMVETGIKVYKGKNDRM